MERTPQKKHTRAGVVAPSVVEFEGVGPCYWDEVEFRRPKEGEFYLSGAIVAAYRTSADLCTAYQVVRPTYRAIRTAGWLRGAEVVL